MSAHHYSLNSIFGAFSAAFQAGSAVEAHRKPKKETLKALGIELKAFDNIRF